MGICILNVVVCLFAEQKYGREVLVIPVDFSDGMEIYPNLAEQLKDLDIGVLSKFMVSALDFAEIPRTYKDNSMHQFWGQFRR